MNAVVAAVVVVVVDGVDGCIYCCLQSETVPISAEQPLPKRPHWPEFIKALENRDTAEGDNIKATAQSEVQNQQGKK